MLYLNNELLTSDRIISYVVKNAAVLSNLPKNDSTPSSLSQLKNKLKTNFFYDDVGCDLKLMSVAPGYIDLAALPPLDPSCPILIKQDDHYYIYGAATGKDGALVQLKSAPIDEAHLDFPKVGAGALLCPYHAKYKSLYETIVSQNKKKIVGCDLTLMTVSSEAKNIRVSTSPKTTPVLIKQGDRLSVCGPLASGDKQWKIAELYPKQKNHFDDLLLDFPEVNAGAKRLSFSPQYQVVYEAIAALTQDMTISQFKIPMDKTTELNIKLNKRPSDSDMQSILANDDRFSSNYLRLKELLITIFAFTYADFASTGTDNNECPALEKLKSIKASDWNMDNAREQFDAFNQTYGYFQDSPNAFAIFTELAAACRTQIVLFEKNNTADDTMAYDYAYKLMALFMDPASQDTPQNIVNAIAKETNTLLSTLEGDTLHPLHDSLLVKLSQLPPAGKLQDKAGWRQFVKDNGVKSFPFLMMADAIEAKINATSTKPAFRAPTSIDEANKMAALCHYKRSSEDKAFAELCYHNKVPEKQFNRCMDYITSGWPKKEKDSIPDIQIKGEGEAAGLYWVKLPVTDKRALILGQIIDCCLYIGGYSEPCVKASVSLNDNCFYVLLKQRKKGNSPLIINGEINEKDFKIIGQSYTWKSKTGNICLDSIECLKNEISPSALKKITSDWANKVLAANPDIKFVTVGRGGKTPANLFAEAAIPEDLRQGLQYGDSRTQYCIAKAPSSLTETQQKELDKVLQRRYPETVRNSIIYLSHYLPASDDVIPQLNSLLGNPRFKQMLTPDALYNFLAANPSPKLSDLTPIDFDALAKMNEEDKAETLKAISPARLIWNAQSIDHLKQVIDYIPEDQRVLPLLLICSQGKLRTVYKRWTNNFSRNGSLLNELTLLIEALPKDSKRQLFLAKDQNNLGLLYYAIECSNQALLSMIITSYENSKSFIDALTENDSLSESPFFYAAIESENTEIMSQIIDKLSERELCEIIRSTGFFRMVADKNIGQSQKFPCLTMLLNSLSEKSQFSVLNAKDNDGKTAWDYAVKSPCLLVSIPEATRLAHQHQQTEHIKRAYVDCLQELKERFQTMKNTVDAKEIDSLSHQLDKKNTGPK